MKSHQDQTLPTNKNRDNTSVILHTTAVRIVLKQFHAVLTVQKSLNCGRTQIYFRNQITMARKSTSPSASPSSDESKSLSKVRTLHNFKSASDALAEAAITNRSEGVFSTAAGISIATAVTLIQHAANILLSPSTQQ